jgi:hypothetical protein
VNGARFVFRRAFSQRMLVVAAAATALLATTVLAALTGYVTSVTGEGLRRTLSGASFAASGVRIQSTNGDLAVADRRVRGTVAGAFGPTPANVSMSARSGSYVLPGQERAGHPELTVFGVISGIEGHARLTAGTWPRDTPAGAAEAALPERAARAMRMPVGTTTTLHSRLGGPAVRVRITGTFAVPRTDDYYLWDGDPLVTQGVQRLGYTTYGPLIVTPGTFAPRFGAGVTATWLVLPDLRTVRAGDLRATANRVRALAPALKRATGADQTVTTALPGLLGQLDRALLVSRSTMLIPAVQLVVLAAYALILVARLLAEHRRMEVALMRARGASGRQIAVSAIAEGLLIALPGAVAAPFAAPPLLRLVSATPAVQATGLRLATSPSPLTWSVAIAVAFTCAVALALPTLRGAARSYTATAALRGRGERRGLIQRGGLDLALLAVAAVSVWQLAHYGGPVTSDVTSAQGLGIDPIIVAGPALALLAGGVVIMRLVPVASRTAERATSRGRGFAPAVGARQVGRRPLRYAGPALLLVLAVAVGVLSITTGVTWRHSQLAQADFQAGPDLRVRPPDDVSGPAAAGQGGRYAALPGVTAISPVFHDSASAGSRDVTLLAADAPEIEGMLRMRPMHGAIAGLVAGRPGTTAATVPGRPGRLSFRIRLHRGSSELAPRVSAIMMDGRGVAHALDLGSVTADGRARTRTADLTALAGPSGVISYPVAIRGFTVVYHELTRQDHPTTLTVEAVRDATGRASGATVPVPPGAAWSGHIDAQTPMTRTPVFAAGGFMRVRLPPINMGQFSSDNSATVTALLAPAGTPAAAAGVTASPPLAAIVTADLASAAHVSTSGRLTFRYGGIEQQIIIAGVVPALPTTTPGQPAILVDWASLTDRTLTDGLPPRPPDEWWLTARGGRTAAAAGVLSSHPQWRTDVVDRSALRERLRDAPLGGGLQGALVLGFAAALAFSVIGFAVNAVVSARERRTEFAIMRALGVSSRQLFGLVAVEQAFLVGLALAGGVLVGVLVAHLVVPHIVLTVRATAPYPPVSLLTPWRPILAMLAGILAVLLVVLGGLVHTLRRRGLGGAVRLGEDR